MTRKENGRNHAAKANYSPNYTPACSFFIIAERVKFSRWRHGRKEFMARMKCLIVECFDQGLISPAGAEFLIQHGGLQHA